MLTQRRRPAGRPRRGAVIVESAFVLVIFLMLVFGIFEYCRYLFVLHVATNAARDAARYAVVNTDKPSTFPTTAYTDGAGKTYVSISQYCTNLMGGSEKNIDGFAVAVFPCDQSKLNQTPPVVQSKTAVAPATVTWNQASFTEKIGVRITGQYRPVLPSFLFMPSILNVNITAVVGSEG